MGGGAWRERGHGAPQVLRPGLARRARFVRACAPPAGPSEGTASMTHPAFPLPTPHPTCGDLGGRQDQACRRYSSRRAAVTRSLSRKSSPMRAESDSTAAPLRASELWDGGEDRVMEPTPTPTHPPTCVALLVSPSSVRSGSYPSYLRLKARRALTSAFCMFSTKVEKRAAPPASSRRRSRATAAVSCAAATPSVLSPAADRGSRSSASCTVAGGGREGGVGVGGGWLAGGRMPR